MRASASNAALRVRDQKPGFTVVNHFRQTADLRRDDRTSARHRVDGRRPKPFAHRAHDKDVEALVQRQHIRTKPCENHVFLEVELAVIWIAKRIRQLALANDEEAGIGDLANDELGGVDKIPLTFVWIEGGDVANNRRPMWQPERLVHVDGRRRLDTLEVDSIADHIEAFGWACGHRPAPTGYTTTNR